MKKVFLPIGALFLLLGTCGCSSDPHQAYVEELNSILRDTLSSLKNIKDVKSAEEQAPRLKDLGAKRESLKGKALGLESITDEEKERLAKEYKKTFQSLLEDIAKEWDRVRLIPKVPETLEKKGAFETWGNNR